MSLAPLTLIAMLLAPDDPPRILQIVRERLKPGAEAAYGKIEEDAARVCARLKCPNPYVALESVSGPSEVWWLNAYASEADTDRVARAYQQNLELMAALKEALQPKQGLTHPPQELLATYRPDLSGGPSWKMRGTRFFVVTVRNADGKAGGSVFEAARGREAAPQDERRRIHSDAADDGTRFTFVPAATRREADRQAAVAGPDARIFAIRPAWSLPAAEWIAADPEFWRASPAARAQ